MTGSSDTTIYNATDGPLAIDRAGRMLAAGEARPVDSVEGSPLAGHISASRIVIVDTGEDSDAGEPDEAPAQEPTTKAARKGRASTSTQEG